MSNYENNAKVRVSIKKKLGNMGEKSRLVERKIEITDDSPLNMRIEKSIGDKIERALARTGRFIGKYSASKYLGQPISEIKAEERRIDNIITDRQAKLDIVDLIDAEEMSGGFRQLIPYEDLLARSGNRCQISHRRNLLSRILLVICAKRRK